MLPIGSDPIIYRSLGGGLLVVNESSVPFSTGTFLHSMREASSFAGYAGAVTSRSSIRWQSLLGLAFEHPVYSDQPTYLAAIGTPKS